MNKQSQLKHLPVDWTSNHDRIILYADIMGFKERLKSTEHSVLVEGLREFIGGLCKSLSPYQTKGHLRMTLFSDLFVIAADRCSPKNFMLIIKTAAALMQECHLKGYPINGCIASGPLTFDAPEILTSSCSYQNKTDAGVLCNLKKRNDNTIYSNQYMPLFVGRSVVDAYLLNEELFCYGIVLDRSIEKYYLDNLDSFKDIDSIPLHMIPVPLKSGGFARMYYLEWTRIKLAENKVDLNGVIRSLLDMEPDSGVRARAYINNTLDIYSEIASKKGQVENNNVDASEKE